MIWFIHRFSFRSSIHTLKIYETREKNLDEGHLKLSFLSSVLFHYIMQQPGKSFHGDETHPASSKSYLHCYEPQKKKKRNKKTLATMVME